MSKETLAKEYKAEIVALAGMVTAMVGMATDHEVAGIIASTPGMFAMFGRYVKGNIPVDTMAKAVADRVGK
ncbi:hypothetical protein ABT282_08145 [Streptomyces sp. NPDC000927]|uniref:hypothetical protein n=1 Tax=Streptomyces sp. NPDC000927 TaxID=3154371 RepID=UPI0033321F53